MALLVYGNCTLTYKELGWCTKGKQFGLVRKTPRSGLSEAGMVLLLALWVWTSDSLFQRTVSLITKW